jgi:hypothetical protein
MSISDDLKTLEELIKDPNVRAGGSARYKNKSYTLAQLVVERDKVVKQLEKMQSAKSAKESEAFIVTPEEREAREKIKRTIYAARGKLKAALENLNIAIDRNGDVAAAQKVVGETYRALQGVNPQDKMLEGIAIPNISRGGQEREGGTDAATSGAGISPSTADTAERASQIETAKRLAADETLTVKSTREVVKNGVTVVQTTYTDGSVTEKAKVVSTAGVTKVPKVVKGVTTAVTPSTDWEATFRSTFPAKAWLLDQDRTKYPQLFALLQKAHDEKYYESTEGQARFAAELQGVDFYNELAASGKVKEIKKIVGDLGFDSTDFSKFVTDSINFGWTGETLKAETYKEVFRKNPDGTYANPTSIKRATAGNDYLNVQLIAKNFFNSAPQSSIESVLTGTITTSDFQRQQRELAKTRYKHLADLIDQGVTLEDLAGNYRQTAAKLLEVDPNTIDMSQGDYEIALAFGEEGKKRAMTTGEWEKLLRTDARYGWEKTENAKGEARSLASNLAQAFGRII